MAFILKTHVKKIIIRVSLLLTCCNFSCSVGLSFCSQKHDLFTLTFFTGIQVSAVCRLSVCLSLWKHVYASRHTTDPLFFFIDAFGCRAGVETLLSGILRKASARLSLHKEHKILCEWKQGKWAYTETKLQSSETHDLLHGKNQCHIHAALFEQPSSWTVKISERFYDRFLGIYLMSDVIRDLPKPVITHGWIRKRTLSVCLQQAAVNMELIDLKSLR